MVLYIPQQVTGVLKNCFDSIKINAQQCKILGLLASVLFGKSDDYYGFDYSTGYNNNNNDKYNGTSDATYFELVEQNGYKILNPTIKIENNYKRFDEIVGRSILIETNPLSNKQAIISIPAVTDKNERLLYMDGKHCNTYQNQTKIMVSHGKIILVQDIITTLMYIKMVKPPQAELKLLYGAQDFLLRIILKIIFIMVVYFFQQMKKLI